MSEDNKLIWKQNLKRVYQPATQKKYGSVLFLRKILELIFKYKKKIQYNRKHKNCDYY